MQEVFVVVGDGSPLQMEAAFAELLATVVHAKSGSLRVEERRKRTIDRLRRQLETADDSSARELLRSRIDRLQEHKDRM
jgi:hypothetical protein